MMKAISIIKSGVHLGDLGEAIQTFVEKEGFSVVRDFCGHGIGKIFHSPPNVLHYGEKGRIDGINTKFPKIPGNKDGKGNETQKPRPYGRQSYCTT